MIDSVFAQAGYELVGQVSIPDRQVYVDVRRIAGISSAYRERDWLRWTTSNSLALAGHEPPEITMAADMLRSAADPAGMAEQKARLDALITSIFAWLDTSTDTTVHLNMRATHSVVMESGQEPVVVPRTYSRVTFSVVGDHGGAGKKSVCRAEPLPSVDDPALSYAYTRAVAQANRLANGADASGWGGDLVLGPHAAATFVHEIVGHLLEADNAASGVLGAHGDQVCSVPLTVIDRGDRSGAWGDLVVDDEGVTSSAVTLLRDGAVAGLLTDRRTAERTGTQANGHGRRASYTDRPLPRLSCLTVTPGVTHPDALVAAVGDGLYVDEFSYGYVNVRTGATRLIVREGRAIHDGSVTGQTYNRGELRFDARAGLAALTGIGDNAEAFPALCAKRGQVLPVLNGGVSLLLDGSPLRRPN